MELYQKLVVDWVARDGALTGLVLFAAGLMYLLCGQRLTGFLSALLCAGGGAALGSIAAGAVPQAKFDPALGAAGGGLAFGIVALCLPRAGGTLATAAVWGAAAAFLATQFGLPDRWVLAPAALLAAAGLVLSALNRRTTGMLTFSAVGAALAVLGFIGTASALVPSIGHTAHNWAAHRSILIPVLLVMLTVTGFSVQANDRKGNIAVGGVGDGNRSLRRPERSSRQPLF